MDKTLVIIIGPHAVGKMTVGATLEYADSVTLLKAIEGRTEV